ncbi:MAG: glycosyltransferase [Proteobacteria bacterium]|nr:glycosyltransferase [Pseudomonadota bacterium]MBI3497876.1 glycosyltransferase [Pseudomonadota bacterium]
MAVIVMTDDGIRFDAASLATGPLGGAETAFASLAAALAGRGHRIVVRNNCSEASDTDGIDWAPLAAGVPEAADLYIANRSHKLISLVAEARRRVFWIHNPASYLMKRRYLWPLFRLKPTVVFSGRYHASTYPLWAPSGPRAIIPYGVGEMFRQAEPLDLAPGPRALFVSNPLRGLDWLLHLWAKRIHPVMPLAELHVFSGPTTYGSFGLAKAQAMEPILEYARQLGNWGVVLRAPVSKTMLADEMRSTRVLLYRGDPSETFCLAVAEAQAAGVPAVVGRLGSVPERVIDGTTGFVTDRETSFAEAAVTLLQDDELWRRQHVAALLTQRHWGWDEAAAAFERLIP